MIKAKHFLVAVALTLPLGLVSTSAFAVSAHNAQTGGDTATNVNEGSSMKSDTMSNGSMSGGMMMKKKHHMKKHMMKKSM